MPSPFTRLPQDILQYEINPYLGIRDRYALNAVLKPDERIYRKIPKDYAIVHEIETKRTLYQSMMRRLNYYMSLRDHEFDYRRGWRERSEIDALKKAELFKKLWAFLRDPLNALLFAHKEEFKEQMIVSVREDLDMHFHNYLPDKGAELRALAKETIAVIESRPFLRRVHFEKRIYLYL